MRRRFTDMLNREIEINFPPARIVSLVPSQTLLLADLGLENEVVGITKFCIHPDKWFRNKTRIGGTKDFNLDKIRNLQPDLIIANKEENEADHILELAEEFPVWISDVRKVDDSLTMIESVGELTGRTSDALYLVNEIQRVFDRTLQTVSNKKVAYLIWNNPMMTINKDTFIHAMLTHCGYVNVFGEKSESRYPVITIEELRDAAPDEVLLSSEPFPFNEKHLASFREELSGIVVRIVDGENWSWYGSTLKNFDPGK